MIRLSQRLENCLEMCPSCQRLIDVGCDHGLLFIAALQRGICRRALGCDLRQGPLERAKENIALYGMGERAETFLTNGLDGIEPLDGDCVFICGMGGDNIADILKRAEWTKNTAVIAQPMTKQYRLRQFLKDHGYNITKERLCRDPRHFYTAMRIEKGEYKGEGHMLFSDAMRDDPLFYDYIAMLREKYRARYEGSRLEKDGLIYSMLKELV